LLKNIYFIPISDNFPDHPTERCRVGSCVKDIYPCDNTGRNFEVCRQKIHWR